MTLAIDTETNGLDFNHGARPFFLSICGDEGEQTWYEWDVDPLTRAVVVPPEDVREVRNRLDVVAGWGVGFDAEIADRHRIVGHNLKFDRHALRHVGIDNVPWDRVDDTIIAAHVIHSNAPKDLTSLSARWLGYDGGHFEEALGKAVKACRHLVQQARLRVKNCTKVTKGRPEPVDPDPSDVALASWRIGEEGLPEMPSVKGETWRTDYWLPRAMAKYQNLPEDHEWWTVLADYANSDTAVTHALWVRLKQELDRRGLVALYREKVRAAGVIYDMERTGVTASRSRLNALRDEYRVDSARAGAVCEAIASRYTGSDGQPFKLQLPKNGVNGSLRELCFGVMRLEPIRGKKSKTAAPSLDKNVIDQYVATMPPNTRELAFLKSLVAKRKRDTAISYLDSYERFGVIEHHGADGGQGVHDTFRLFPNVNPTGTDTTRLSSNNPNGQNLSKKEDRCRRCEDEPPEVVAGCPACGGSGYAFRNPRTAFGPAPDREWWWFDASNIELRLPAYEAGEQALIDLFEKPDEPPYFGSNHLVNFHAVYPDLWAAAERKVGADKAGKFCKREYANTWYQWCKNGWFAIQYGAVLKSNGWGTADQAFHKRGAHELLFSRLNKLADLNRKWIKFANQHGYVETIPDRTIDATKGYPLLCSRTEHGRVLETVPLSYHIQGTAGWWMVRAMTNTGAVLDDWRRSLLRKFDARLVLSVHDELVFDFPRAGHPLKNPKASNLGRANELRRVMSEFGHRGYNIPLPVTGEYSTESYSTGVAV